MNHTAKNHSKLHNLTAIGIGVALCFATGCGNSPGGNSPSPALSSPGLQTNSPTPMTTPSATPSPDPTKTPGSKSPSPSKTPNSKSPSPSKTPGDATPGEGSETPTPDESATPGKASFLTPIPGVKAPALKKVVKVKFTTDLGPIMIEVYPEAAPNASKRFEELVRSGFYDNTPIFRIVPNFVAQFGINSASKHKPWKDKNFNDDPSLFLLQPGTLAFAKAGPNINSTQVFINYGDNTASLVPQNFTAFAKITQGFDLTLKFKRVGDPNMGLDQGELWKDTNAYLNMLPDKPNMITKAEVVQ